MKRFVLIIILLLSTSYFAFSQSIEELRSQIQKAEEEIRITNELLGKTQKDQKNNRNQLRLVQNNINNRKKIISNLDQQISIINQDVNSKNKTVSVLQEELDKLKTEYAALIRSSYKSYRLNNILVFLFASKDFHDVTQRIYYIKRYTMMRERKAASIDSLSIALNTDISDLNLKKESLDSTVRSRNQELGKLSREEQNYRKIDTSLGSQARKYSQQISKQRNTINQLQQQIQRIIAEEARKSQSTKRTSVEEEAFVKLSGQFDQNKGKLPFPVSGGVIIDRYGTHAHPSQKGLMVNNKGVNIAAERGANVRAVFDGTVVKVFFFQGLNNSVLVRHGSYLTVYSNLETVNVKAGDKVSINQTLGRIYSGDNVENHMLHFEIWQETQNLNPEAWLRR